MPRGKQPVKASSGGTEFLPGLALDAVIFGFHNRQLKVLLLEYKSSGLFALPGGFIKRKENLGAAAARVVSHRTGLTDIFLSQFYTFGDYSRYDPRPLQKIMRAIGADKPANRWLLDRYITVGYYALVDFTKAIPAPDEISDSCTWYAMDAIPELMLDHAAIIAKALRTLQLNLDRELTGFNLLPKEFTLGELQAVYETILGKPLIRAAFQRKLLGQGILEKIAKKMTGKAHKAPYLYRFVANGGN